MRRPSSPVLVATALWTLLGFSAIVGPLVFAEPAQRIDLALANLGPGPDHWWGTDPLGRDLFARTLAATPLSLGLAILAAGIGALVGIPWGASVAVLGPRTRRLVSRTILTLVTFPSMLIALFLVAILGPASCSAAVAIGVALAPGFARTAQALAAGVASADYVSAARLIGVRNLPLMWRYILPNTAETLIIRTSTAAGSALVLIAGFSFLGFGVQPPAFDWGRMLSQGLRSLYVTPLAALAPGLAITVAGLAFSFLGDALAVGRHGRSADRAPPCGPEPLAAAARLTGRDDLVLRVENLSVAFGASTAVCGVSLEIRAGEIVGLVGESGSGKTTLALAAIGLPPDRARVQADVLDVLGKDLLTSSAKALDPILGAKVAVVFQDALSAFNPALKVGPQIAERLEVHAHASRAAAKAATAAALGEVCVAAPARRARQFPHEFSGGMLQRAMIAMGLVTEPALLVADEPTTALDVTVQAQVLDVLRAINRRHGTAILFVSHDLAVVAQLCSRVIVMQDGRIVEVLAANDLAERAQHPYTRELVRRSQGLVDLGDAEALG